MDCRKTLGLGVCLLIGAVGCTRHDTTLPVIPPAQASKAKAPASTPVDAVPPGAVVKQLELPKHPPQAATCVAAGDFLTLEAASADLAENMRQAKREQARKAYEQAIALDPHCLQAYLSLAQLYITIKDHSDAEATYRKAAQLFPNEARVFFEMGRCYGAEKQWDLSVHALARAVELDPKNRPYVDALGWTQARAGRYDDSLATFRRVYDEAEAQFRLAEMLEHLGEAEPCRQHLRAALNKDPQMDKAKALLAKLDAAPPADGVKPAAFVTADKPSAPAVVAAVGMDRDPAAPPPSARGVMLPPPPHIPIRYEAAQTPDAPPPPPPLPMLPGPEMNLSR